MKRTGDTVERGTASLARVLLVLLAAGCAIQAQEREPLEVYRDRRAALAQKLNDGLVLLFGNTEGPGSEAFHILPQESNFYYLTGLDAPGAVLLLVPPGARPASRSPGDRPGDALGQPREILFLPERSPEQELWTGPKLDPHSPSIQDQTGFAAVLGMKSLAAEVRRYGQGSRTVYTILPDPHGSETEQAVQKERLARLRSLFPSASVRDARNSLAALRQIKSETELERIRRAVECTIEAHLAAGREIRPGLFEYEIAALMKYTFERMGCRRPSFDPIVASGPRSTIVHYTRNSERTERGDLIILDVGAEYGHYAADITRTWPVSGRFSARQREVYEVVLGAHKAAIAAVKPGARLYGRGSLHQIASDYINLHGKDRAGKPLGKYFTHGLSHHVGLDVHDPGDTGRPLEPGMVITIEPGVYLPEENLGVRIEDMLLVTETGAILLTERLAREAEEIEQWMNEDGSARAPQDVKNLGVHLRRGVE